MIALCNMRNASKYKLIIIIITVLFYGCKNNCKIRFNDFKLYSVDHNPNIDTDQKYYLLFLICIKYNLPVSTYKSMTNFSDNKIKQIINDLEFSKYIKVKGQNIKPLIFIADNTDKQDLEKLSEESAEKISKIITLDSVFIKSEFNSLQLSKKDNFKKWEFFFVGNILLGQGQLFSISESLLNDTLNKYNYNICYNAIIENDNPILNNFYYNNYIDGTSASSICEFGNYNQLSLEYWHDPERNNIIPPEDNFAMYSISSKYSKKILPVLRSDLRRIKEFYNNSHFKNEIEFNVFYFWYYHFLYSKSIKILIDQGIIQKQENNFKYTRLNYCG